MIPYQSKITIIRNNNFKKHNTLLKNFLKIINNFQTISVLLCNFPSTIIILEKAAIHTDVYGSDHCPIELQINIDQ